MVLVTGASGFIGRAADRRRSRRRPSRCAPRCATAARGHFPPASRSRGSPTSPAPIDWSPLLAGMDAVVHLAGIAHVGTGHSGGDLRPRQPSGDRGARRARPRRPASSASSSSPRSARRAGAARRPSARPRPIRRSRPTPMAAPSSPPKRPCAHPACRTRSCGRCWSTAPGAKGNLASLMRLARAARCRCRSGGSRNRRSLLARRQSDRGHSLRARRPRAPRTRPSSSPTRKPSASPRSSRSAAPRWAAGRARSGAAAPVRRAVRA